MLLPSVVCRLRVLLLLGLVCVLSACQPTIHRQKVVISKPEPIVEWLPVCSITSAAYWLDTLADQLGCVAPLRFTATHIVDDQHQPILALSDSAISPEQWRTGQRPGPLQRVANRSTFGAFLRQGLRQLERYGVLLQASAVVSGSDALSTGVYHANTLSQALLSGNTVLSNPKNRLLSPPLRHFSATFGAADCQSASLPGRRLGVPPRQSPVLSFAVELSGVSSVSKVSLIKHWLSLDGTLHQRSWVLPAHVSCIAIQDSSFDPLLSSVWHIEAAGHWFSSPIWYSPIKG